MVWGTENGNSLTFSGTQNSNMSDEGAKNNNKEVFPVFVTPFKLKRTLILNLLKLFVEEVEDVLLRLLAATVGDVP